MLELPVLIEPLFRAAGWQGPSTPQPAAQALSAHAIASRIIEEFGGLQVGACGSGTELAASDVHFYDRVCPDENNLARDWERQAGQLVAFASAHHDHMVLFVGNDGSFYMYTDPDAQLYAGPKDFGELMRRVLWGHAYGPMMPKDADAPPAKGR